MSCRLISTFKGYDIVCEFLRMATFSVYFHPQNGPQSNNLLKLNKCTFYYFLQLSKIQNTVMLSNWVLHIKLYLMSFGRTVFLSFWFFFHLQVSIKIFYQFLSIRIPCYFTCTNACHLCAKLYSILYQWNKYNLLRCNCLLCKSTNKIIKH